MDDAGFRVAERGVLCVRYVSIEDALAEEYAREVET